MESLPCFFFFAWYQRLPVPLAGLTGSLCLELVQLRHNGKSPPPSVWLHNKQGLGSVTLYHCLLYFYITLFCGVVVCCLKLCGRGGSSWQAQFQEGIVRPRHDHWPLGMVCEIPFNSQTKTHQTKKKKPTTILSFFSFLFLSLSLFTFGKGEVVASCGDKELSIAVAEIDLGYLDKIRANMPVCSHRRPDVYGSIQYNSSSWSVVCAVMT